MSHLLALQDTGEQMMQLRTHISTPPTHESQDACNVVAAALSCTILIPADLCAMKHVNACVLPAFRNHE